VLHLCIQHVGTLGVAVLFRARVVDGHTSTTDILEATASAVGVVGYIADMALL
jgi:hypothetical protein